MILNRLKEQVEAVFLEESIFHVSYGEDKYIFGVMYSVEDKELDIFAISSIYDTIIDLNTKIKYSFEAVVMCNPSENLMEHKPFEKLSESDIKTLYYIENMIFRTSTLWDMLAQICNIFWKVNKPINKIYTASFFYDCSQDKNEKPLAKDIYYYFKEEDEIKSDRELWKGNFEYVKEYRNKMTHRNSPNISTFSNFGIQLRPPAIFVLKRVTEDYLKAIEFIIRILDDILIELENETFNE